MKTLFTAEAISKGGRSGTIRTADGLLDVLLGDAEVTLVVDEAGVPEEALPLR